MIEKPTTASEFLQNIEEILFEAFETKEKLKKDPLKSSLVDVECKIKIQYQISTWRELYRAQEEMQDVGSTAIDRTESQKSTEDFSVKPISRDKAGNMTIICMRCNGTGFLNADQMDDGVWDKSTIDVEARLEWITKNNGHDVSVCDCCGDGERWYGVPGEHYNDEDPPGYDGPYDYNGGLCECH